MYSITKWPKTIGPNSNLPCPLPQIKTSFLGLIVLLYLLKLSVSIKIVCYFCKFKQGVQTSPGSDSELRTIEAENPQKVNNSQPQLTIY